MHISTDLSPWSQHLAAVFNVALIYALWSRGKVIIWLNLRFRLMSSVWNFSAQDADVSLGGFESRPMWGGCFCRLFICLQVQKWTFLSVNLKQQGVGWGLITGMLWYYKLDTLWFADPCSFTASLVREYSTLLGAKQDRPSHHWTQVLASGGSHPYPTDTGKGTFLNWHKLLFSSNT